MAGESPDRSKQRESSAEPTPGSASPVPEARSERDPRLAVAREATSTSSQRGGVDTATKIFSIRELRPETAEDEERGGEANGAGDAGGSGGSGGSGRAGGSREAVGSGEAGGSDGPESADGPSSAEGGESADGPESAEGGERPKDVESAEGADVSAGDEDAETAEDVDAQNPSAEGSPAGDARLRAAVTAWVSGADEPDGSAAEEPAGADDAGATDAAGAASTAEDSAKSAESAETVVVATRTAKDRPEDAEAAAETEEGSVSAAAAGTAEAGQDAETEDEPQDAVPETAEAADEAEAEAASDEITDARPEATGTPEDAVRDADETSEADGDADETSEADGDADEELQDAAPNASEDEPEDTAPDAPDASAAEPEDTAPRASEDEPEDAAPDAPEDAAGEPEDAAPASETPDPNPGADPDPEPEAADGAAAPQAPAAPGDATRTGGAGGKTGAGDGVAAAVDQPTAVFKAVRPPKPAVDQPTTTLKAPPAPEAHAERTSKFVALKPLDEPRAPRTPRPDATRPVAQVGPERTTQQPLPPKPPLDLLAELTNTPPPPQTPVRTAIRRVKIWTPLVVLLAIAFAVVQALRPLPTPSLTLTAEDSYTFDGSKANLPWPSEGQGWMDVNGIGTMGSFGKQTPVAIGSVAKAMTAYIVLKDHPLKSGAEGEKITVDATAEKEGGYDKDGESTLNTVKAGDVLTEKQALSAIMIPSANNIARLLARWDAGSEAAFIKKMNDTAKALGMTNTTYTDASGLKETTVSTAEDQVKLGNQLVKIQALMDITKLPSWVDPSGKKWTNYNRLVPYNDSLGIKTGTTTAAGGNLLFAATKEVGGETAVVVGAILGQHTAPIIDTVNAVSKTAMLAAQDAMKSAKILKKGDVVGYVDDQLGGHTPVVVTKDVAAVGWAGLKVKLSFAPDAVPHTAKAGTKVGTLTVGDGSGGAVKVPVALQKDLAEPALTAKLKRLG